MKKILCFLLAGCFAFGMSACFPSDQTKQDDDGTTPESITTTQPPADMKTLSENYTNDLVTGMFQAVADHFSSELNTKIGVDELRSTWNKAVEKCGKFQKIYKTTKTESDRNTTIAEILQYENDGLQLVLTMNSVGEIEDVYIKTYTILSSLISNSTFEETSIQIGSGVYLLDGVLTMPKRVKNPPVAILVQDYGQSDLNETTGTVHNKPFQDVAWDLASKGIATIRFNKRFYQYPQLYTKAATVQDDVLNDVGNAVQYAKSCPLINTKKIIIIGHGFGGMLAPKIAQDNPDVDGIVVMAGSPRQWEDITVDQEKKQDTDGVKGEQLTEQSGQVKNLTGQEDTDILGINSHYWYSLNQIDTQNIVKQLTIPMLFLQGSEDFQIDTDADYSQWKTLLGSKRHVTYRLYDGLNHLFMQANGKTDMTEYDIAGHVDTSVIDDIADFIK